MIHHVVKRMELLSALKCSLQLDVLLMELKLRVMGLITDLDELHKFSERGLKLGAETWYDQTSFCCCFKTFANGTEAACTEANFLVGIVVIVLGYESWRSCVTLSILEFFIHDKSCSLGTGALGLRNIFTSLLYYSLIAEVVQVELDLQHMVKIVLFIFCFG